MLLSIDRQALERLRELVGGSDSDVVELVDSFLDEAPATMDGLLAAMQQSELAGMRRAAHSIKSNARDMGAVELAEISSRIEACCASGTFPNSADVEQARQALHDAMSELRNIFGSGPGL